MEKVIAGLHEPSLSAEMMIIIDDATCVHHLHGVFVCCINPFFVYYKADRLPKEREERRGGIVQENDIKKLGLIQLSGARFEGDSFRTQINCVFHSE